MTINSDTLQSAGQAYIDPNMAHFEKQIDQACQKSVDQFKKIRRFYFKFHSAFFLGTLLEL
ncbi:MAG TPA: hypothetical protein VLF61_03815, partial [Rhabdochlamydiaceae bacterium]|nr:hypothetical protein [Rhabdochlamydiaceae bacterium]